MAAATIAEIRQGIADNLADAFGADVQTSAYELEQVFPPSIMVVAVDRVNFDEAGIRGLDEITLTLRGFGGQLINRGAQVVLDSWLNTSGATSVKAAVESDRTLGGKVEDTVVIDAGNYRRFKLEDATVLLGVEWSVRVLNRGA